MKKNRENKGSALLIVLGIITVVTITAGAMSFTATQQMRSAQITRDMLKARLIAESGLNKAYNSVKTDFTRISSCSEKGDLGGGTFTVHAVTALGGNPNRAQLVSEGLCGLGRAVVSADLENIPVKTGDDDASDDFFPMFYDLLVGGDLLLNGNIRALFDAIFSNGTLTVGGSSFLGATKLSSAKKVVIKNPKKVSGPYTTEENCPPQAISPEALTAAIDAFKAYAQANDAVYASGADIPVAPPGGVAYCTGDASAWSGQGTGCFIFEGEVSFQGSGIDVQSVDGYPALIVLSASEVKLNADAVVHGAIIMPNASFKVNGHAEIHGAILVGQGMGGNGTADLYPGDAGQGFNLPPQQTITDNVVITAWH
ncbi:MAG TPA: hypothetical protein PLU38_04995 [Kiritimatiellia bacterium]|mgnify:FL=1|nr:MAG: hypothetical protein BWX70_00397 [Verrucomicrobia bacterium ADurb.Bin070]HPO36817.1 hypothetical protein [Kiritimatiellia bacterium]HQQ91202.1 hypothetical protein [Kiritimatiellia bacterium]